MASGTGRLSNLNLFLFALTSVPAASMLLMLGVYLPRFFAMHVGISMVSVAAVLTFVRLIDIPFDPLVGAVMDRTRTPIGRYRIWLICSAPLLMVAVYMLFNAPQGATEGYLFGWLLVFYAGYSIFTLAHAAWAAALATSYHERSRIYGWITGIGVFGSVGLLILPTVTHGAIDPGNASSMNLISLVIIGLLPVTILIVAFFTPERIAPKVEGQKFKLIEYWQAISRPNMARLIAADLLLTLGPGTTGPIYIFFFHDVKHFPVPVVSTLLIGYVGAGLIGAPTWGKIAQYLGKHRTIQIASVFYAITQTILMIIPAGLFWETFAGMIAVGFCASSFLPLLRSMVADVADEVRLEQGKEQLGLLYAMVTSTQKVAQAVSVTIIFSILALVGYQAREGVTNTPEAINGLQMCYLFAPIILVFFGAFCFFGYKLDNKRHAEIREALDARDAESRAMLDDRNAPGTAPA